MTLTKGLKWSVPDIKVQYELQIFTDMKLLLSETAENT